MLWVSACGFRFGSQLRSFTLGITIRAMLWFSKAGTLPSVSMLCFDWFTLGLCFLLPLVDTRRVPRRSLWSRPSTRQQPEARTSKTKLWFWLLLMLQWFLMLLMPLMRRTVSPLETVHYPTVGGLYLLILIWWLCIWIKYRRPGKTRSMRVCCCCQLLFLWRAVYIYDNYSLTLCGQGVGATLAAFTGLPCSTLSRHATTSLPVLHVLPSSALLLP